jgi:hypothetical protein
MTLSVSRLYSIDNRIIKYGAGDGVRIGRRNRNAENTRPSATLSTTNPTFSDHRTKPGRHDGKPATNRLSYGTVTPASGTVLNKGLTLALRRLQRKCNI